MEKPLEIVQKVKVANLNTVHAHNAELLAAMKRECFPNWEDVQREVIEAERKC